MTKLALLLLFLAAIAGWIMNLVSVIGSAIANDPLTAGFIVRIIGVPVPVIGAIMGWF